MRLKFSADIAQLLDLIRGELTPDQDLYIVGGALRDILLGRELHDLDFVLPEDPTNLAKKIADKLEVGFFVLDDERHTARVLFHRENHHPFPLDFVKFTGEDLLADLQHRDFTVNAIAMNIRNPEKILDPLGGIQDLAKGVLRTCSEVSLIVDPVRVLRGIRLAMQFNFKYTPGVSERMAQASQNLPQTSCERQRDEFFKILEGPDPALGMVQCRQFGVFETLILSLVEQEEIPASPPHTLPLFDHSLQVIEYLEIILESLLNSKDRYPEEPWWVSSLVSKLGKFSEPLESYLKEEITPGRSKKGLILFGALIHDIGKPMTLSLGEDGYLHFYSHAQIGADLAWQAAKNLQLSNVESEWVKIMVRDHMKLLPLVNKGKIPSRRDSFRFFKDAGEVGVAISLLSLADTMGTYNQNLNPEKWENALEVSQAMMSAWWNHKDTVIKPQLLLNGDDLQEQFGLKPGKEIGELLDELLEAQASGEILTKDGAEKFIHERLDQYLNQGSDYENEN